QPVQGPVDQSAIERLTATLRAPKPRRSMEHDREPCERRKIELLEGCLLKDTSALASQIHHRHFYPSLSFVRASPPPSSRPALGGAGWNHTTRAPVGATPPRGSPPLAAHTPGLLVTNAANML